MSPALETTYRRAVISNARRLLSTAEHLLQKEEYPVACFLAMTTIEEVGKLNVARFAELAGQKLTHKLLRHLSVHPVKAAQAATGGLFINAGADRRQGKHPVSGIHRTSGVIGLARSGHWMHIRNSCLYVDADLGASVVHVPPAEIGRDHAYYFICMAFEVIAEHAEAGLDSPVLFAEGHEGFKFWEDTLRELEAFMKTWAGECDVDHLDFLINPDALIKAAEGREKNETARRSRKGMTQRVAPAPALDFEGKVDKGSAWTHRDSTQQITAWLDGINDLLEPES